MVILPGGGGGFYTQHPYCKINRVFQKVNVSPSVGKSVEGSSTNFGPKKKATGVGSHS
jgi:hypothetical protein